MEDREFSKTVMSLVKQIYTQIVNGVIKAYEPYELTMPQALLLMSLNKRGSVKVGELSELLKTPDSNVSAICSRLAERGFITRERDKTDRRVVYIKPLPKSQALFSELEEREMEALCLWGIDERDKTEILSALKKLNNLLERGKLNNRD